MSIGRPHAGLTGAPTSEVWNRILWIRCGPKSGTAFTIEIEDRQFLITAAHVVEHLAGGSPLERNVDGRWMPIEAVRIDSDPAFVDVAIFACDRQLTVAMPIEFGHDNFVLGQDLMIVGYPFDVAQFARDPDPVYLASGSPLPMVKRASFASQRKAPGQGHWTLFVDCYATPGFSGAPVVGYRLGIPNGPITIAAVVSHYVPESQPVLVAGEKTAMTASQNPGILVAEDIKHAIDGIHAAGPSRGVLVRVVGA